jgi:hypothetical protein
MNSTVRQRYLSLIPADFPAVVAEMPQVAPDGGVAVEPLFGNSAQ